MSILDCKKKRVRRAAIKKISGLCLKICIGTWRENSGVQFRIWATNILREYIKKGFAMDDDRLKELGGGGYFSELLERICDIRASEKVFYRQVLEIYATSVDYNLNAEVSIQFFKRVQNKIHYAVSGETAAEVIYHRADAEIGFLANSNIFHYPKQ